MREQLLEAYFYAASGLKLKTKEALHQRFPTGVEKHIGKNAERVAKDV